MAEEVWVKEGSKSSLQEEFSLSELVTQKVFEEPLNPYMSEN